jgi:hypothetical protein
MAARATIVAFSTEIAPSLSRTFGRNEYGLVGDAEERSELAFQRRPKANRSLDGDDDGLDLDTRTFFATRTIPLRGALLTRLPARTVFEARTIPLRDSFVTRLATRTIFETRTIPLRGALLTRLPARTVFEARTITLRDSFVTRLATRTIFYLRTVSGGSAILWLTRFAWFALFTRLALRCGLLC